MDQEELSERLKSVKGKKGIPKVLTQTEAVEKSKEYVKKRASGEIVILETSYDKLNKACAFELNTMLTISGLSGGGKSTLAKRLENSIIDNLKKKGKKCLALSFNFEMLAHKTIGREVVNLSKMPLRQLYSIDHPLSSLAMEKVFREQYSKLIDYPILYVEEPQDHKTIGNTIYYYWKSMCKADGTVLIVEIDHAVITKGKDGDTQKNKIDNLMETLNSIKKKIAAEGGDVFFIVLSQMNREIRHRDRLTTPELHYPQSSDLFASSSIEFFSDYILITHMPSKLNIKKYTDNSLPVYLQEKDDSETSFIYWHILKNRDGEPDQILPMLNDLKHFNFEEVPVEHFKKYTQQFDDDGSCTRIVSK